MRYDEHGPWIPLTPADTEPGWDRDGMHSGVGGLVHALTRVALVRPWTTAESELAEAVGVRLRTHTTEDVTFFDGMVSDLEALTLLGEPGVEPITARLLAADPATWEHRNDVTLGTGALVHGGLVADAPELVRHAAALLLAEAEETPHGLNWLFVPRRHVPPDRLEDGRPVEMPNHSHGLAGIAGVLARAGVALDDPALVDAARRGAEHFVSLADPALLERGALAVPRRIPPKPGEDAYTWNWCHGPAGSLALFEALDAAGVTDVAGDPPAVWLERCLEALRTSGIPERRHPGFWDNDGRCCGTAGVGSAVLPHDPALALRMADALADRAYVDGDRAHWRFVEHRADDPLLPPGVGWMQGTAGIAGFLFEVSALSA
ncbi:hypothetical protein G5V58_09575 [Nocardioides anomalus]|uniref:Lanthionine synthetase C family protein n=1 Tax=Nocardioides anomalus TaxID=2712223 RepID=A0A6G6WL57_9ACTN|nr:hypothetical protein G5V58_09575 [Nocardioides anomalus]